jgi:hypothetical protein
MKNTIKKTILFCILSISILSCSKDDDSTSTPIDDTVKDAASLMNKMTISGAIIKSGDIPVPSGVHTDNITGMPNTIIVTSNSLFTVPVIANIADGRKPRMVFIKLEGSDEYYQIDLDINGNPINRDEQHVRFSCSGAPDIRLEANGMETPSYENYAQVYTYSPPLQSPVEDLTNFLNPQYWSLQYQIMFKVLEVGTGDVQISLTWDTYSDVDLWLTEPNGNKIYYANSVSNTGGVLDFDNTYAFGPENIYYSNEAPSGTYKVEVNYYSGAPVETHYNVVVKNGSTYNTYEGILSTEDQTNTVVSFTK